MDKKGQYWIVDVRDGNIRRRCVKYRRTLNSWSDSHCDKYHMSDDAIEPIERLYTAREIER